MRRKLENIIATTDKLMYVLSREQKYYGILVLILSFVGAILETLGVSLIIPLINSLLNLKDFINNKWISALIDMFHIEDMSNVILIVGGFTILIYLFKNLYFILLSWVRAKYACKVQRELSIRMMKTYMGKGYPFFLTVNTSELMRGVFSDTSGVYSFLNQLFKLIIEFLTVVLICIYILKTDWTLAISVIILMSICLLINIGYFKNRMEKSGEKYRKYGALVNQNAIQAFQGIKEVIVGKKQKYFVDNFEKACIEQHKASVAHTVGVESPTYIIEAICIAGLLGVIICRIVYGGEDANAMIPTLSAFAIGAFRILPGLGKISSSYNTMSFYIPNLIEMYKLMREAEENDDNIDELYSEISKEKIEFKNELSIENVSWKYREGQDNILNELSMTIKKGKSVAFVGHSGAGKTTLADIILGLLMPQNGQVLLDGKDIFGMGKNWGKVIGYVPQSVYLIDSSIRNNIAFGVEDKDIDDAKVWQALEQAQLKEFVEKLDMQLDTKVGERGVRFSGGQRQRVAIARALYSNPEILVLDEATAALDNETEKAVMDSIEALQGHKTLIIIAHRITTIKKCDEIYEILNGKAQKRTYEELQK